ALLLAQAGFCGESALAFPPPQSAYPQASGVWETLAARAQSAPFNVFATLIFGCAIVHTFFYRRFLEWSEHLERRARLAGGFEKGRRRGKKRAVFMAEVFHLLGEVEAIFALWLVPLFIGFALCYGWSGLTAYLDNLTFERGKYVEPVFVVAVMCVAATRPIIQLSGDIISMFARLGGGRVWAWWASIIVAGPLLGSFITEPAAITICAALLSEKFFSRNPSMKFRYATLGLLFVAVSVGGTLTHFSAPPVLMVASQWGWDMPCMLENFGWKAVVGVAVSVAAVGLLFRREFVKMQSAPERISASGKFEGRAPASVVAAHVAFLAFIVVSLHHPALFIFAFLLFLAFVGATCHHQYSLDLKMPLLVGLFLAALVTHGGLQAWWIEPVLENLGEGEAFIGTLVLSAFNDNAAITYLATLAPNFSPRMQYVVVAAAVSAGGLTIIANAPNPAGAAILRRRFGKGISPAKLFLGSALPTAIVSAVFYFL
ncbi:MAG: hypothetical protein IJI37_06710, partial [Opitutales bacterium]|nr:hypothetical protein [Opitutales bacterium]